jgi:trehalose/maltose hydrolase-like predicted phosphorylase
MAGTLDLAQRCYTGLELRDGVLRLVPALPPGLPGLVMESETAGQKQWATVLAPTRALRADDRRL